MLIRGTTLPFIETRMDIADVKKTNLEKPTADIKCQTRRYRVGHITLRKRPRIGHIAARHKLN